jgi:hypothetical protein
MDSTLKSTSKILQTGHFINIRYSSLNFFNVSHLTKNGHLFNSNVTEIYHCLWLHKVGFIKLPKEGIPRWQLEGGSRKRVS